MKLEKFENLEKLIEYIRNGVSKLDESTPYLDILPLIRINIELFQPLMQDFWENDLTSRPFNGGYLGLYGLGFNGKPGNSYIGELEWEYVILKSEFLTIQSEGGILDIENRTLVDYIAMIMTNDCTGCCDTLSYIRISSEGLISEGDISRTYHS